MTFSEMKQELSEVLAESGTRTYTTAQRERWLNRGVIDVCRKTLCLQKTVTKNVTAATRIYKLRTDWSLTDFIEFAKQGIIYDDNNATANSRKFLPLRRRTVDWFDENIHGWRITGTANRSDDPEYYARLGEQDVYIQPVPKTAVTNGFIINYHYFPIQSTTLGGLVNVSDVPFNAGTTDNVTYMEPYHLLPVLYAAYRALLKAGVPKKNDVLAEYTAGIKEVQMLVGGGGDMGAAPDYEPRLSVFNYRAR